MSGRVEPALLTTLICLTSSSQEDLNRAKKMATLALRWSRWIFGTPVLTHDGLMFWRRVLLQSLIAIIVHSLTLKLDNVYEDMGLVVSLEFIFVLDSIKIIWNLPFLDISQEAYSIWHQIMIFFSYWKRCSVFSMYNQERKNIKYIMIFAIKLQILKDL